MQIYEAEREDMMRSQNRDPLLRHLTRTIVGLARQYGGPPSTTRVIDVGCGVGRTSLALATAGFAVTGVDPSERAIQMAVAHATDAEMSGSVHYHVGDATVAPPEDWQAAFDLAICSEVIEHVPAPAAVLRFCRLVLRPGGILILTTPHDRRQWTVMDDYAGHVTRFTPRELDQLLEDGFERLDLATEGFPFQRLVMQAYDRMLRRQGGEHDYASFGRSTPYMLYTVLMPHVLSFDHRLRRLMRGTTLVAVARRNDAADS